MQLFPAQVAAHWICGIKLPMDLDGELKDRIKDGRIMLMKITGLDFGYDLRAWHDHLKQTGEAGYSWRRNIDLPKIMKEAVASDDWKNAVAELPAEIDPSELKPKPLTAAERRRRDKILREIDENRIGSE